MSSQTSKKDLKKKAILEGLKQRPFSEQKSSSILLETIQKQKSGFKNQEQAYSLLVKQRDVVMRLDHENIQLIDQNKTLTNNLVANETKLFTSQKVNGELREQNESLKQQLLISQMNCAKMVSELNRIKRKASLRVKA